jgi:hypothetical protein
MKSIVFLLLPLLAGAQQPNSAITGVVVDAASGRPLPNYSVSTSVGQKDVSSTTDEQGRYRLSDLPPGLYRIDARNSQGAGFIGVVTRHITTAGQDLDHIDFKVRVAGGITGKVVDENREPVVGASVFLVSREYYSGVLGYFFKDVTRTDDRGVYKLKRVEPGQAYLVMADNAEGRLPAHSDAPLDPKLRRRAIVRTFYPNSPDRQGGSVVTVNPGDTREGVDIEARKAPTFCVEGMTMGLGGPGAMQFVLEGAQPAYGTSSNSGMFGAGNRGMTGPDGKYRICGLVPGSYRLGVSDTYDSKAANRALAAFDITDRDLRNLNLTVSPGMTVQGEVAWLPPAPEEPSTTKVIVVGNPLLRSPVANERPFARVDLPGSFAFTGLLPTDYALDFRINGPGLYIREVEYGGKNVLYEPLHVGATAADQGIRIVVGRDGGKIAAKVADKDGNALPDLRVVILPASISSEAMLQAALVQGQTNQLGQYQSPALRPGKYLVLATDDRIDATPECIDNLWRSRTHFQEVDVAPGGTQQMTLLPVNLRR